MMGVREKGSRRPVCLSESSHRHPSSPHLDRVPNPPASAPVRGQFSKTSADDRMTHSTYTGACDPLPNRCERRRPCPRTRTLNAATRTESAPNAPRRCATHELHHFYSVARPAEQDSPASRTDRTCMRRPSAPFRTLSGASANRRRVVREPAHALRRPCLGRLRTVRGALRTDHPRMPNTRTLVVDRLPRDRERCKPGCEPVRRESERPTNPVRPTRSISPNAPHAE